DPRRCAARHAGGAQAAGCPAGGAGPLARPDMKIARIAATLLLLAMPAWGQPLPVLSDMGPDAAAFGAAEGYPAGTRATLGHQNTMVGAYSHFDQILPSNPVPRAATPAPF